MSWSAELKSVSRKGTMTLPVVRFVSTEAGVEPFEEVFQGDDINPDKLAKIAKRRIVQLEGRDAEFKKFVVGPIDVSAVALESEPSAEAKP